MPRNPMLPLALPFTALLLPTLAAAQDPAPPATPETPKIRIVRPRVAPDAGRARDRAEAATPDRAVEEALEEALAETEAADGLGERIRDAVRKALRSAQRAAGRADADAESGDAEPSERDIRLHRILGGSRDAGGAGAPRVRVFVDGVEQPLGAAEVEGLVEDVVTEVDVEMPDIAAILRDVEMPDVGAILEEVEAELEMTELEIPDIDLPDLGAIEGLETLRDLPKRLRGMFGRTSDDDGDTDGDTDAKVHVLKAGADGFVLDVRGDGAAPRIRRVRGIGGGTSGATDDDGTVVRVGTGDGATAEVRVFRSDDDAPAAPRRTARRRAVEVVEVPAIVRRATGRAAADGSEPESASGDAELRRELQELRERIHALEKALEKRARDV